jgi:hypothetical protein
MEYHLGLDSEDWGYWLQAEPHGMGGDGGLNACYTHIHVGVYFDGFGLDPPNVGSQLEKVIDKHLEECDPAGWDAHNYEKIDDYTDPDENGCISINPNVENLGSYLAAYNAGSFEEELEERPIEYIAWGALYWATARQRTTRSQTVNHAIEADACNQRAEQPEEIAHQEEEHGESVQWRHAHGPDVVCSHCGSGWAIDQDRIEEPEPVEFPEPTPSSDSGEQSLRERWPSANWAVSVGESLRNTEIRDKVTTYIEIHGADVPVPRLLAQLSISPTKRSLVSDILEGARETPVESFSNPVDDGWELVAIVEDDGTEHSPGGGGVDMVNLHLPVQLLLEETRLQHDVKSGEHYRCGSCNVAMGGNADREMARHLVDHGFDDAETADRMLIVEDYHDRDRECMSPPEGHVSEYSAKLKDASEYDQHQ